MVCRLDAEKFFKVTLLRSSENRALRENCLSMLISVHLSAIMVSAQYVRQEDGTGLFDARDTGYMVLGKRDSQEDLGDRDRDLK